jgi:hypothetical protein
MPLGLVGAMISGMALVLLISMEPPGAARRIKAHVGSGSAVLKPLFKNQRRITAESLQPLHRCR